MVSPPPMMTRSAGRPRCVPAILAPRIPVPASPIRVTATISHSRAVAVGANSPSSGSRPPMKKLAAEAVAACSGRAAVMSECPSSSRKWAPSGSASCSARGYLLGQWLGHPAPPVDAHQLRQFGLGVGGQFTRLSDAQRAAHPDVQAAMYSRRHRIKSGLGIALSCTSDGQKHVRLRTGSRLHTRRIA
jgi:hypothetical protein